MVSNLPFGSGVAACSSSPQAHLTHVSALSGRAPARIRPVMREPLAEEPASRSRFPAAFRPPAFASRVILCPPGSSSLPHGRPTGRRSLPDPDGVVTFRMVEIRPGWVPSVPRGRRCAPDRSLDPGRRLPPSSGQSLFPARASHRRESYMTRHHRGFTRSPVRSSPACSPRMEREPLGFPRASHPAVTRDARQGGDGPCTLDRELRHRHQPVLLLRVPLAPCDLVSHPPLVVEPDQRGARGSGGDPAAW